MVMGVFGNLGIGKVTIGGGILDLGVFAVYVCVCRAMIRVKTRVQ